MRAAIARRPILRLMLPTGCTRAGPVAQRLEPAAHNGLVGGSIPSRPTNVFNILRSFSAVTVQRSGGSSRLRQLWAWRGDWIEHTTEPGAEHAVVDRAADLKKQIGASPRPSHLLRFIHSPVDQEIRGTFGN
jgi:hypothetical protein